MSLPARVRLVLARSPWLYWAVVAALAGAAGLFVMRAADGVEAARESWGDSRRVLVATRDVEPGDLLDGAADLRPLPAPMLPPDAVTELEEGAVARQRIAAGEVVVAHDLGPSGAPQTLIPSGWLAVAISEPVASGARVGNAVSVATGGVVLATEGIVVGLVGEALLVAVPADIAPQVAQAASTGDVAVLLAP
jgi:SAF domain